MRYQELENAFPEMGRRLALNSYNNHLTYLVLLFSIFVGFYHFGTIITVMVEEMMAT